MEIKPRDEVKVEFDLLVDNLRFDAKRGIVWGYDKDGTYCCVPLTACKKKESQ